MTLQILSDKFSVSKLSRMPDLSTIDGIYFTACTDREISLVCGESSVPLDIALRVDSGWRAMRIKGELDFSLRFRMRWRLAKYPSLRCRLTIPIMCS